MATSTACLDGSQSVWRVELNVQAVPVLGMPMQRISIGLDRVRVRGSTSVVLKISGKRASFERFFLSPMAPSVSLSKNGFSY